MLSHLLKVLGRMRRASHAAELATTSAPATGAAAGAAPLTTSIAPAGTASLSLSTILQAVLERHGLAGASAFNATGQVLAAVGNPAAMQYTGLTVSLLGSPEARANTFAYLDGRELLPQLHSQGRDNAILDVLTPGVAVVYLAPPTAGPAGDAVEYYRWAKALALAARADYHSRQ